MDGHPAHRATAAPGLEGTLHACGASPQSLKLRCYSEIRQLYLRLTESRGRRKSRAGTGRQRPIGIAVAAGNRVRLRWCKVEAWLGSIAAHDAAGRAG